MQGLGGTGAQQSKDCSFPAGSVLGAPLRVSWFLVIFFFYQLAQACQGQGLPLWFRAGQVIGNEFLLLLTVLTHEMGHGTMARHLGGEISQVLLWPFGGICFTTRPSGRNSREKLVDDLKIVGAGPLTHFPQSMSWLVLLMGLRMAWGLQGLDSVWKHVIPFSSPPQPCVSLQVALPGCIQSMGGYLLYSLLVQAIQLNVMLFLFNVFFPMYPMDGAKLIVCSLQLFCKSSSKFAAKVLIYTSTPLAVLFIGKALWPGITGSGSVDAMSGISAYLGFMCLMETYRIWNLMKEERLHTHPLFEGARSDIVAIGDGQGMSQRLNTSDRDDVEAAGQRIAMADVTPLRPFSGAGRPLGEGGSSSGAPSDAGRTAWLNKFDKQTTEKTKTVRQLEEDRLADSKLISRDK